MILEVDNEDGKYSKIEINGRSVMLSEKKKLRLFNRISELFRDLFLPVGYPESVESEYLEFQFWDTVQALCSYLRGILSMKAILEGLGVGKSEATASGAVIQWIMKDGLSMIGGILFSCWGCNRFDEDICSWRLFADLINDIGLFLEMLAPLFPSRFLLILSIGSICKCLCGVSAGATRSCISCHLSKNNNMGDVGAKENTQETGITLVGLVLGIYLSPILNSNIYIAWISFIILTMIHMYSNYCGVKCLKLRYINKERSKLLWDGYKSKENDEMQLSSLFKKEHLFYFLRNKYNINMGINDNMMSLYNSDDIINCIRIFKNENFIIIPFKNRSYDVILLKGSRSEDEMKSYIICVNAIDSQSKDNTNNNNNDVYSVENIEKSYKYVNSEWNSFFKSLSEYGYNTNHIVLSTNPSRWNIIKKNE